jgi:hypothetical protein
MLQRRSEEVGMVSKSVLQGVTAFALILFASCGSVLPWSDENPRNEVNLAFTIENNLIFLTTARINNQAGRVFFSSASQRSVIDPKFAQTLASNHYELRISPKATLPFQPAVVPLSGIGDVMLGADVWASHAVTIDYRSGLLTYQREGIHPEDMAIFHFTAEPAITATVDGRQVQLVVDTALPDTLVLPAEKSDRRKAHVVIAGTDFGDVEIRLDNVSGGRIGNRMLARYLVSIDYGKRVVGLWRR